MKSGGGSSAHVGMYVGEDWWTFLSTYDDHTPILDVTCGSATMSLSVADRQTGAAAVEFARDLADKAAKFAAEVERLHLLGHSDGPGWRASMSARRRWNSRRTWRPGRRRSRPRSSGCTPGTPAVTAGPARAAPGLVRRPDGHRWWGGRNGHSCRPGCLPLLAHAERR